VAVALFAKLGAVPEVVERLGVGERVDIPHRLVVDDVAHRQLHELAA